MSYTARRLPSHRGPAAWAEVLKGAVQYPRLEEKVAADVVVIGAGFAGLSAARRMLQLEPEANVIVLEAGRIAEGAAGRNSGFMIDLPHDLTSEDYAGSGDDQILIGLNRQAIQFARQAVEEYEISSDFFDPAGKVNGAASAAAEAQNASYAAHLKSLGEPSETLDAPAMYELTGSTHYRGGLYTPGTVMLQPAGYIRGFASGVSLAAQVYEKSPVLGLARTGPYWLIRTPKGQVTSPRVILGVNGHLESFGVAKGRLIQLFLFASMTPSLDGAAQRQTGAARWGVTPSDPMGTTMRKIDAAQGGPRIVTRTAAVVRPAMKPTEADMRRAKRLHDQKFAQRFPKLAGMRQQYSWGGHLCLSLNGVAYARQIDEGLFSACVQNGLGTARGTLTGIAAAEKACGHRSNITDFFDVEDAPKPLPPQPLATWGANAVLRWKEWRAGAE